MIKRFRIEGIITALLTPLTKDEQVKEDALRELIDFQVESGIHGFFPLGTAGEGMKLEIHPLHSVLEERYFIYPDATQKVMEGKKKSATIYAVEEE